MAINLIKVSSSSGDIFFTPSSITKFELATGSSDLVFILKDLTQVTLTTPSPADAASKLADILAAFAAEGTLLTVDDSATA